jgi:serine/threonine-protein kinase
MSDFLSQFQSSAAQPIGAPSAPVGSPGAKATARSNAAPSSSAASAEGAVLASHTTSTALSLPEALATGIRPVEHEVEIDGSYRRKKLLRWAIIVAAALILIIAGLLIWHFSRLVEVPELVGKPLATAQSFSRDNGVELELNEVYSLEAERGIILAQDVAAGKTVTKGSVLALTASKGADPDERLALPDFSTLKRPAAEEWIAEVRADNLRLVQEYSDSVPAGDFLRIEFRGDAVNAENYRRRDYATLYYSKGAEVFEKNIVVPDFKDKAQSEVENWADTNSIELAVAEADSDTVAAGSVISQSVAAGEKLAKHDAFAITVSLGKASVVPNFANYTADTAAEAAGGVPIVVKTRYDGSVAYGHLISQSLPSGTRLLAGDERTVTVVYSEGQPYLKDYTGTSEGELPAAFFNDYTTKGANVSYELRYVDSSKPKGSVVGMSDYSCFIPMNFHVVIDISRGNLTPPPTTTPSP